jgi:hypothetical protein
MVVGCIMLVHVGLRAAGSVSRERVRKTLDSLLTMPFGRTAILFAKWLCSVSAPRWGWFVLAPVWAIAVLTGGMSVFAVPCYVLAWMTFAAAMASLGTFFSVVSPTTARSTIWTLLATGLLLASACLAAYSLAPEESAPGAYSLVPPAALGLTPFYGGDFRTYIPSAGDHDGLAAVERAWDQLHSGMAARGQFFPYLALSVAGWMVLAGLFWWLAARRFQKIAGPKTRNGAVPQTRGERESRIATTLSLLSCLLFRRADSVGTSWHKRLVPGLLLVLPSAVLMAVYGYYSLSAAARLRDALAEADRLDPGWRLEDLELNRAIVPDADNSSLQVSKAYSTPPGNGYDQFFKKFYKVYPFTNVPGPEVQLNAVQVQALAEGLSQVQAALREARKLADMPHGRPPVSWNPDGTSIDEIQPKRSLANLLTYDMLLRAQQGDADGALQSCRAIMNTARSLGDEPSLLPVLVRYAIRGIATARTERTLAQGQPSEAALVAAQGLYQDEERQQLLVLGTRGERAWCERQAISLKNHKLSIRKLTDLVMGAKTILPAEIEILLNGSLDSQHAALLQLYNQVVEVAKLPAPEQNAAYAKLSANSRSMPLLARPLLPMMNKLVGADLRCLAALRCTCVMLAVERFRLRHARWPDTLHELVPEFLCMVPDDPFDGQPLRYRRVADGVVIYSVFMDLQDNGGNLYRGGGYTPGIDLGVRLWDVARRHQPSPDDFVGPPRPGAETGP